MISRNLKDFRNFVKERGFFVFENEANFSEKIEPKDVKMEFLLYQRELLMILMSK